MKTTRDIAIMISDCFKKCINVYETCELCDYYDRCYMIETAFRMILEGNYYG